MSPDPFTHAIPLDRQNRETSLVNHLNAIFDTHYTDAASFRDTADRKNPLLRCFYYQDDDNSRRQLMQLQALYPSLDKTSKSWLKGTLAKVWNTLYKIDEPTVVARWAMEHGLTTLGIDTLVEWQDHIATGLLRDMYYLAAVPHGVEICKRIQPYIQKHVQENRYCTWANILHHPEKYAHRRFEYIPGYSAFNEWFEQKDYANILNAAFQKGWSSHLAYRLERHLKTSSPKEDAKTPRREFAAQVLQLMNLRHEIYTSEIDDFKPWCALLTDSDVQRFDAARAAIRMLEQIGYDRETIASSLRWSENGIACLDTPPVQNLPDDFRP